MSTEIKMYSFWVLAFRPSGLPGVMAKFQPEEDKIEQEATMDIGSFGSPVLFLTHWKLEAATGCSNWGIFRNDNSFGWNRV